MQKNYLAESDPDFPTFNTIAVTYQTGILTLTLNRPESLNAMSPELLNELNLALGHIEAQPQVRVLLIKGTGTRAFSAGADLKFLRAADDAAKRKYIETAYTTLERMACLPIVTISALHGYALGGGLELALACDLRIASQEAELGLPELALGSVPSFGAVQRLTRLIGQSRATGLLLTGDRLSGEEACSHGLVHKSVDIGTLDAAAEDLANEMASRAPEAIRYLKLTLKHHDTSADFASAVHALISVNCHASASYQQATTKFTPAPVNP